MTTQFLEIILLSRDFTFGGRDEVEDPLDEALQEQGLGEVTGSGSGSGRSNIDIEVVDLERGLALIREVLIRLGVARSTVINQYKPKQVVHEVYTGDGSVVGGANLVGRARLNKKAAKSRKPTKANINYGEGDWILVPLEEGGFAVGVVARMDHRGMVLGYFFGPKRAHAPGLDELAGLLATDAIKVRIFGDLGLLKGFWKNLGRCTNWNREAWPMPSFCRHHPDLDVPPRRVEYADDTFREIHCMPISVSECALLPRDGMSGFKAIESVLGDRLAGTASRP